MRKVAEVLAGLRDERTRLLGELAGVERAIAALEEVLGIAPARAPVVADEDEERAIVPATAASPAAVAPEPPRPPGPYTNSNLYQAVADYLAKAGEPRTTREIAEALQAGGYRTRAANFPATVRTMLQRKVSVMPYRIHETESGGRWYVRS